VEPQRKSNLVHFTFKIWYLGQQLWWLSRNCTYRRNHDENREYFSFSRSWPWAYFLNGPNAAESVACSLIRHWTALRLTSWMIKLRAGITRRNLIFRGRDMAGSSAVDMIIWWMIVCGSHLAFIDCACAQITMTTAVSSTAAPMYLWRDNSAFVPHRMSAPDSGISAAWEMGRNYFRPPVSARLSSENMARFFYRIQGPSETFQSMSWFSGGGTKTVGVRGPGVFTWYHTRIGSMNFNFRGPLGGTPGAAKSKIKIRAHFVVLPKTHNTTTFWILLEHLNSLI